MFEDIVEALRNPVEGVDYAALADSLVTQATKLTQGYEAAVAQKDSSIKTLTEESSELKAHNYSLMMKVNTNPNPLTKTLESDDESTISGIKDLF